MGKSHRDYEKEMEMATQMLKEIVESRCDCTDYNFNHCKVCPVGIICEPGLAKDKMFEAAVALYTIKYGAEATAELLI
jgi:hypothetical protein